MSFVNKILTKYSLLLEVQPVKTRCITTAVTMGFGDTISQFVTKEKDEKWDKWRTARMSFVGFSLMGPCLYFWHRMLERKSIKYGITGTKGVIGKVFIDQLIYAPSMLGSVLISLGFLEGRSKEDISSSLSTSYFPILRTNYMFWPFVVLINFRYVPYLYRTVFINVAQVMWGVYLSDYRLRHFRTIPTHNQSNIDSLCVENNNNEKGLVSTLP